MLLRHVFLSLSLLTILLGSCGPAALPTPTAAPLTETATDSPVPLTDTATPTDTPTPAPTDTPAGGTPVPWPSGEGACSLITTGPTTIYARPSLAAAVFAEVGAGFETAITGRTATGWAGFDPAIAQAANIGPFRLRWVPFDPAAFSGDCVSVPEFWAPLAGLCYTMPMQMVDVFADPDPASPMLTALELGDFAAVLGVAGGNWAQIYLTPGNSGLDGVGWIDVASLNVNGPCEGVLGSP